MGSVKNKKVQKKKCTKTTPLDKFRKQWIQIRPVLFFVSGCALLMILFYILWFSDFYNQQIHPHIVHVNAVLSTFILNIFGFGVSANGGVLQSKIFSINILKGCDAIEAIALLSAVILSFPAKWKYKLPGLLVGIAILFFLNLFRIITLFLTGIYTPALFEIMHIEVWQFIFIAGAVGIWIFWIKWTKKRLQDVSD